MSEFTSGEDLGDQHEPRDNVRKLNTGAASVAPATDAMLEEQEEWEREDVALEQAERSGDTTNYMSAKLTECGDTNGDGDCPACINNRSLCPKYVEPESVLTTAVSSESQEEVYKAALAELDEPQGRTVSTPPSPPVIIIDTDKKPEPPKYRNPFAFSHIEYHSDMGGVVKAYVPGDIPVPAAYINNLGVEFFIKREFTKHEPEHMPMKDDLVIAIPSPEQASEMAKARIRAYKETPYEITEGSEQERDLLREWEAEAAETTILTTAGEGIKANGDNPTA